MGNIGRWDLGNGLECPRIRRSLQFKRRESHSLHTVTVHFRKGGGAGGSAFIFFHQFKVCLPVKIVRVETIHRAKQGKWRDFL